MKVTIFKFPNSFSFRCSSMCIKVQLCSERRLYWCTQSARLPLLERLPACCFQTCRTDIAAKKQMGSLPSGKASVTCLLPCEGTAEHSGACGASSDYVPRRGTHLYCRTQRETRCVIENGGFGTSVWICPWMHISISS